jgi:hypothetical protein
MEAWKEGKKQEKRMRRNGGKTILDRMKEKEGKRQEGTKIERMNNKKTRKEKRRTIERTQTEMREIERNEEAKKK